MKLTKEIIERFVAKSVKSSFALEGRVVPEGFKRSEAAEKFLKDRRR